MRKQSTGIVLVNPWFMPLLLVPFQTLYARKFFYQYNGGIFEHWKLVVDSCKGIKGYGGVF